MVVINFIAELHSSLSQLPSNSGALLVEFIVMASAELSLVTITSVATTLVATNNTMVDKKKFDRLYSMFSFSLEVFI